MSITVEVRRVEKRSERCFTMQVTAWLDNGIEKL